MSLINANAKQRIVVGNKLPIVLTYDGEGELEINISKSIIPLLQSIDQNMPGICVMFEREMTKNVKYPSNVKWLSPISKTGHWTLRNFRPIGSFNDLDAFQHALENNNGNLEFIYNSAYDNVKDSYLTEFINWTNDNWRPHYISIRATIRYNGDNMTRTYIYSNVVRVYLD